MLPTTCLFALAAAPLALCVEPSAAPATPRTLPAFAPAALRVQPESRPLSATLDAESRARTTAPADKYDFEYVEFKTRDKQKVHAAYFAPRKKGKAPAALLVHDAGSQAEHLLSLADGLQRKGFAVLVPDLRGHGKSVTENCNWNTIQDAEVRRSTWTYAMRDLEASTEYLRDLDRVHNANLNMVGVGAGAVLATRYALHDENARSVALVAPNDEDFGFNLGQDIIKLGGLPVLIMTTKEGRQDVLRIQGAARDANDGLEFVTVKSLKPKKANDVFSDRRLNGELAKFLRAQAMPKR